jgi:hypothetical protein
VARVTTGRDLPLFGGLTRVIVAEEAAKVLVERISDLAELVQSPAHLATDLRQLARPEDEHSHDEHDHQVPGCQEAFHSMGA